MTSKHIIVTITLCCIHLMGLAQRTTIDSVEINGNDRTKGWVIERELLLIQGETYDSNELVTKLTLSRNRIMNLNLFNAVSTAIEVREDKSILKIDVIEKWYVWPIPFLEFSDRNFNVWQDLKFDPDRTNYGLYLFNYNLFGRNHTLKFSVIRGYHDRLGLVYRIPYFSPSSRTGLEFEAFYDSQNEVWLQTVDDKLRFFRNGENNLIKQNYANLKFTYQHQAFLKSSVYAGVTQTEIADAVLDENTTLNYLDLGNAEQSRVHIGASLEEDKRDNRFLPMQGSYKAVDFNYHDYNASETNNVSLELHWQQFSQFAKRWYTAFGVFGRYNTNHNLPYYNYRMLGYRQIVRGFEDYVVDGHAGLKVSTALRYHLVKDKTLGVNFMPLESYKFLPVNIFLEYFIDVGYAQSDYTILSNSLELY